MCGSLATAPWTVSLEPLTTRGAVRVTWSPPADLCGLTNPQYTIQYGRTTSTSTTHPSTPSSSPLTITGLEVGEEYFVRVAVRTQSGSGTFSGWQSVTTSEGVSVTNACDCSFRNSTSVINCNAWCMLVFVDHFENQMFWL